METFSHNHPEPTDRPPSSSEYVAAHEEALVINDEVNKLTAVEGHSATLTDLAETAIRIRTDKLQEALSQTPESKEVSDEIRRTYLRFAPESGILIYVDPKVETDSMEEIEQFYSFIKSVEFREIIARANGLMPKEYNQINIEDLPPVFIHSPTNALRMQQEHSRGFHDTKAKAANIHLIADSKHDLGSIFIHELTHCQEPFQTRTIKYFQEGIATLVERRSFNPNYDPHTNLIDCLIRSDLQTSDHPLASAYNSHDGTINISFEQILTLRPIEQIDRSESWLIMEAVRDYMLTGSFLDWYSNYIDSELRFLERLQPNYDQLYALLIRVFPDEYQDVRIESPQMQGLPTGVQPPPRLLRRPISTVPPKLQQINSLQSRIVMPDDDPFLLQVLENASVISHQKTDPENIQLKELLQKVWSEIQERSTEMEVKYSKYLEESLNNN